MGVYSSGRLLEISQFGEGVYLNGAFIPENTVLWKRMSMQLYKYYKLINYCVVLLCYLRLLTITSKKYIMEIRSLSNNLWD